MFRRVLIANRGEIAVRVARALRELDVESVAVFSDADAGAPHTAAADVAVRIGPAEARRSYLSVEALLDAAARTSADALHPGYGFLAESPALARACAAAGVTFVGPPAEAIELMGDKARARALAREAGVPVVPGLEGDDLGEADVAAFAAEHGYPVLVKAVAGGGGKGMRVVRQAGDLAAALAAARREAEAAFGDGRVLVERYLEGPRHVEVQVLADGHGNVVHLGERDCSLQRRHQKVVEEAPAPGIDAAARERLGGAAVALARACGYEGAGTVELLLAPGGPDAGFFFLEMNTRLQVEHPVTELVCGLDLVHAQLRVAAGEPLWLSQADVALRGHAVEARLYAEDPDAGFLPATGRLVAWEAPDGVRVDAGVAVGSEVTTHYDPMLAKLVAHGPDRAAALRRLDRGLRELVALGVRTNQGFLRHVLARPEVRAGAVDTGLLERIAGELRADLPADLAPAAALALFLADEEARAAEGDVPLGWQGGSAPAPWRVRLAAAGQPAQELTVRGTASGAVVGETRAAVRRLASGRLQVELDGVARRYAVARSGDELWIGRDGAVAAFHRPDPIAGHHGEGADTLEAPMPGVVIAVHVVDGQRVAAGEVLLVLESMKMELPVAAPHAGVVAALALQPGDRVALGQALASVLADEEDA